MTSRRLLFAQAVFLAAPVWLSGATSAQIAHSITIYRDTYGVPHIFGPTDASCVFGAVYLQAEHNF